jgi:hypothetical protein
MSVSQRDDAVEFKILLRVTFITTVTKKFKKSLAGFMCPAALT